MQFARRLQSLCIEKQIPTIGLQRRLAKAFGVSQPAVRKWLHGEGYPTMDKAIEIAKYFDVSIEWLLTGRGRQTIQPEPDALYRKIADILHTMPKSQQDRTLEAFRVLTEPAAAYFGPADEKKEPHDVPNPDPKRGASAN
jgi:transcriptional regulator with XRE-family HTH domain